MQAHLDGCPACRAELAEFSDLVPALRAVDPARLGDPVLTPTPDLGARIVALATAEGMVRAEQERFARRRRALTRVVAAAAGLAAVLALGVGVGRQSVSTRETALPGPTSSPTSVVPTEQVLLASSSSGISVSSALLVPHGWGVEVRFVATGLQPGQPYQAWVVDRAGTRSQAGTFVGVGARPLTCNMQSAVLRPDAASFFINDASGNVVLSASLPVRAA